MAPKPYTPREMRQVVSRIKETLLHAEGESAVIDVIGDMRSIESGIANLRKGAAVEFEDGMEGERWRFTQGSSAKRSYNSPRLVQKFSLASDESLFDTIMLLIHEDALRFDWQWTNLEKAAAKYKVTLVTAQQEITDGDDADIGVYWRSGYPSYKKVE